MSLGLFVTGTDTGIGKTRAACTLLRGFVSLPTRAIGMKPVASGIGAHEKCNPDVGALIEAANVTAPLADVNPYAFSAPIAPHLAARQQHATIDLATIGAAYERLAECADVIVVEGAGGVLAPLSERADMLDIPRSLQLSVLLVVGLRLGCINHALLSVAAIDARGLRLTGWIANRIDPEMAAADENVAALVERIPAPLIADMPWHPEGAQPVRSMLEFCRAAAPDFQVDRA